MMATHRPASELPADYESPAAAGDMLEGDHGSVEATYIVEGAGVLVARSANSFKRGRIVIGDNMIFGNGVAGIALHQADRVSVLRNRVFANGITPAEEFDRPNTTGLVLEAVRDIEMLGNVIDARSASDRALFPSFI